MAQSQPESSDEKGRRIESWALTAEQIPRLLSKLESHLPYTIPLLRRIQFHLHHRISSTARVFVAAVVGGTYGEVRPSASSDDVATNGDVGGLDAWLAETQPREQPWIAAHIDLANAGQTAVWVYGSWEHDP